MGESEGPIQSLLPHPYSWLLGTGEHLVQPRDPHSPLEEERAGAPRW